MTKISGYIIDVFKRTLEKGVICIENGKITDILPAQEVEMQFLLPGLIDAHIHIESSMMTASEFARYSLPLGTVACICDPHEIANVCGIAGVDFMIEDGKESPMNFYFGAPSCVPATSFETSGATIDSNGIANLLNRDDVPFLSELMNYPGILAGDKEVLKKIDIAQQLGKPIDGHAPQLKGTDLKTYIHAGISTDHECITIEEAEDKIALGMHILIREGSAAKNFNNLIPLLDLHPDRVMFCSDDKHPDDLIQKTHINTLVKRALADGYDLFDVIRACTLNPISHYKLDVGLLQLGDSADFIIVDSLKDFNVISTYIKGERVAHQGIVTYDRVHIKQTINNFNAQPLLIPQLQVLKKEGKLKVIEVIDGQLYTKCLLTIPSCIDNYVVPDIDNDILKIVVYNRYEPAQPAIGFIKNFGIKTGALASTVAHDSHNIVAIGTTDEEIIKAINEIIKFSGGICICNADEIDILPLPIGGLMSNLSGEEIANKYQSLDNKAKQMGSKLHAPFMTLAFMSLLVIPELKLSDKGLFDGNNFKLTDLFC
jgi:adenine deaminase